MDKLSHLMAELTAVQKPAQYLGGERHMVRKDPTGRLRMALAFPDLYEIGMSYTGFHLLYHLLNREDWIYAERVFAPWPDMAALLRKSRTQLFTLETKDPVSVMDVVGFTFQYELGCTGVLHMLDLAGIPVRARDRESGPLIMAGGPCVYNPEPMAPFVDVFYMGEAERKLVPVLARIRQLNQEGLTREQVLAELDESFPFLYVPSRHPVHPGMPFWTVSGDVRIHRTFPDRFVKDDLPDTLIVPNVSIVYDRITLEISRGCDEGCRFCQAGMIYRPARERDPDTLVEAADRFAETTGHDEISLSSLSTSDYPGIEHLVGMMIDRFEGERISTALPSLRADRFRESFAEDIKRVRKTGFTIAPEAGSQRLRDVINKNLTEEDILQAAETAFRHGWSHVKLYFMIGLPTETDDDLAEMVRLAEAVSRLSRKGSVVLSASTFVPKPHTPFQWCGQISPDETRRRQVLIRRMIRTGRIKPRFHDADQSFLEGLISRGDRRTADLIERAWRNGACFDGWTERFDMAAWREALNRSDVSVEVLFRELSFEDRLPWDMVDVGVDRGFLAREYQRALNGETTSMCVSPASCNGCRACSPAVVGSRFKDRAAMAERVAELREAQPKQGSDAMSDQRLFYRFEYCKTGLSRFVSHLDLVNLFSRAFRSARLPVAFTRGFNPRPVLSFAPALELGVAGERELLIGEFTGPLDEERAAASLNGCLPEGISVRTVTPVSMAERKMLARDATLHYQVTFPGVPRLDPCWRDRQLEKRTRKGVRTVRLGDVIQKVEVAGVRAEIQVRHTQRSGSVRISRALPLIFPESDISHAIIVRCHIQLDEGP